VPNLEEFRQQTRTWLEENCPASMRKPIKSDKDQCWGGRKLDSAAVAERIWRRWPV
jgi:acyl-CoA dehydrogenase